MTEPVVILNVQVWPNEKVREAENTKVLKDLNDEDRKSFQSVDVHPTRFEGVK